MIAKRFRWVPVVVCVGLVGCGGAAQSKAPRAPGGDVNAPADPALESQSPAAAQEREGAAGTQPNSSGPRRKRARPPSGYAQPPPHGQTVGGSVGADVWTLLEDFTVAEDLTLSGQGGCADACRALRSMVRSAQRLCAMAENEDEQRVCREVHRRVRQARDFVRASCGRCEKGPDLDAVE